MTLTFYRDYQELFQGCIVYYDGTMSGSSFQNLITPGTYDGLVNGSMFQTGTNRFGKLNTTRICAGVNTEYISNLPAITYQNGAALIWFYSTNPSGSDQGLITANNSSSPYQAFVIAIKTSTGEIIFWIRQVDGSTAIVKSTIGLTANTWYCIAVSWGTTYKMNMVLGTATGHVETLYNNNSWYPASNPVPVYAGLYSNSGSVRNNPLNGSMNEIMIFKDVHVSPVQLRMLYEITRKKYLYPVLPGQRGVE